ncbi:MAG: queuosine precursor transporter [Peptococcaceae bacterium]|nr:queuosine precursor transporter [Peptococcaceae bacterium]
MSSEIFHNPDSTKKFSWVAVLFVVTLITSNLMASKLVVFGSLILPASVILYPVCFMLGCVLAEGWGGGKARQVILMGFVANAILVVFTNIAVLMYFEPELYGGQTSFQAVYQGLPRILFASFVAYLVSEICTAFFAKGIRKLALSRHLFVRVIGAVVVGQAFDTPLFMLIAFYGVVQDVVLAPMMLAYFGIKVLVGAVLTPMVYVAVHWVKHHG